MSEAVRTVLIASVVTLFAACDGPPEAVASNDNGNGRQDWQTLSLNRGMASEQQMRVDVEYGAGRLSVAAGTTEQLYQARLRYDASAFEPVTSYSDGQLQIGMKDAELRGRKLEAGSLDLQLNPNVALDLDLAFGAAEAKIDLGGLRVRSLEISTGASKTDLAFSQLNPIAAERVVLQVGAAQFIATGLGNANTGRLSVEGGVGDIDLDFTGALPSDMNISVEMGLGHLTLRLPREVGVRIQKDGILSSIKGAALVQRGNVYYSPDYDSAERRLHFDIDAAFNAISVILVDNDQADVQ